MRGERVRENVGSSCSVARMFERRKARLDLKKAKLYGVAKKKADSMELLIYKKVNGAIFLIMSCSLTLSKDSLTGKKLTWQHWIVAC